MRSTAVRRVDQVERFEMLFNFAVRCTLAEARGHARWCGARSAVPAARVGRIRTRALQAALLPAFFVVLRRTVACGLPRGRGGRMCVTACGTRRFGDFLHR